MNVGPGDAGDWAGVRDGRSYRRDYRNNATGRGRKGRTGNGEEEVVSFIRWTHRECLDKGTDRLGRRSERERKRMKPRLMKPLAEPSFGSRTSEGGPVGGDRVAP